MPHRHYQASTQWHAVAAAARCCGPVATTSCKRGCTTAGTWRCAAFDAVVVGGVVRTLPMARSRRRLKKTRAKVQVGVQRKRSGSKKQQLPKPPQDLSGVAAFLRDKANTRSGSALPALLCVCAACY